jgi:molybdate transport system permease protein
VWLLVPAGIATLLLAMPFVALLVRLDWANVPSAITSPAALQALVLSLTTASSRPSCVSCWRPLALVIARATGALAATLRTLTALPLVLPPLVGGIALLSLFGRAPAGRSPRARRHPDPVHDRRRRDRPDVRRAPFLVISVEGALRTNGTAHEAVAASLGAHPFTVFRRVTLPLVAPGLVAGTVLCFARALGEFGATACSPATPRASPGRCRSRSTPRSTARASEGHRDRPRCCSSSSPWPCSC